MAMPQEVIILRAGLMYMPYLGSFWYLHKHASCARKMEQHVTVGFKPPMTAVLQTASSAMLQFADTLPTLIATTMARAKATTIATAFTMPTICTSEERVNEDYIKMCGLVVYGSESMHILA
jgi:hypothetical protein